MKRIIYFFRTEILYFIDNVAPNARRLIASNVVRSVASPLMGIFLNAFVWRATSSLVDVSVYNILQFVGLPLGFFLNGFLLRRIRIEKAFALGAVLQGLGALAVVLLGSRNAQLIPFCGFVWGLGGGFYWGNRNYLELQETAIEWRQYFYGLLHSVSSGASIVVPFLAGWFIVLVQYFGLLPAQSAYWLLFFAAFVLMMFCAAIVFRGSFQTPAVRMISRLGISPLWNKRRLLNVAIGLFNGIEYTGILLVLYMLGNEGILGTISSFTAVCVMIGLYAYGRNVKLSRAMRTIVASGTVFFLCTLFLSVLPGEYGVTLYFICGGLALQFSAVAADPELLSLTDEEMEGRSEERYSFIVDNELFLNLGRISGIMVILGMTMLFSEKIGFVYGPLAVATLHMVSLLVFAQKHDDRSYALSR